MNNTTVQSLLDLTHAGARLFAGSSLLLVATLGNSLPMLLLQLSVLILIHALLDQGSKRLGRAFALLRWLLIPIVLLHLLFTPGELLIAGMAWPVSVEGLQSGLWYALHLAVIFFAAMLLSILLRREEWVALFVAMPVFGARLLPYVILMERSLAHTQAMVESAYAAWRNGDRGFRSFMAYLTILPVQAYAESHQLARDVWESWDQYLERLLSAEAGHQSRLLPSLAVTTCGIVMIWSVIHGGF